MGDSGDSDATISDMELTDNEGSGSMEVVNTVPSSPIGPDDEEEEPAGDEEPGEVLNEPEPGEISETREAGELPAEKCEEKEEKSSKETTEESSDKDDDDTSVCPICMDIWTNSGDHRLVCLRCGHLFGHSCIVRWLKLCCNPGQRRCPQCNKRASQHDIRFLYAPRRLQVLDTSERDRLKNQVDTLQLEKSKLELELARVKMCARMHQVEMEGLKLKLTGMQNEARCLPPPTTSSNKGKFSLIDTLEICKNEGCRVLAFCPWYNILCVSQSSSNSLFSGFGVKKIDVTNLKPTQFVFLHQKPIRDLSFNPHCRDMLLSVSMDNSAKLVSILSSTVIHSFNAEAPLWSCSWDATNSYHFYVGNQRGVIMLYDIRQLHTSVLSLSEETAKSPVASVVSVPPTTGPVAPHGGLLVCRLNSVWTYKRRTANEFSGFQTPLDGPFTSLCYDPKTDLALVSARPNIRFRQSTHILYQLGEEETGMMLNPIHTFLGSMSQKLLSRPCQMAVPDDTYIAAHCESSECIAIWSASTRDCVQRLRTKDSIIDLCPLKVGENLSLAALSPNSLSVYNFS